jgi:hypothetical protein
VHAKTAGREGCEADASECWRIEPADLSYDGHGYARRIGQRPNR